MSKASADKMDRDIGALIRERRYRKKMSQPDLAEALGVSSMAVQHYETGRSSLTVVKLVQIAEALGCRTKDLMP